MVPALDSGASLAKRCIESTLNVSVEHWDRPPRQGAYDLRFEASGRTVAVEVKLVVDPVYRAAEREADRLGYVANPHLSRMWDVRMLHGASWKLALQQIPPILLYLEELDWPNEAKLWHLRRIDRQLHNQLERLRVVSVWWHPPTERHPPGFYLMPDGMGGIMPGVEALPGFLASLLASKRMAKLRSQLRKADTDERHAFAVLGWENLQAHCLLDPRGSLPIQPPGLPEMIDGIWVTGTASESRVIAWLPSRGWIGSGPP